jgi:2-methylisocitrate lyase-like PEP mutase family enzyme
MTPVPSVIATFRRLHESGCFVIPNPWDVGSAVYLHLGFKALATSSAGFAFTRGRPDALDAVSRDATLAHVREVVETTSIGFADEPDGVAENVRLCVLVHRGRDR